MTSTRWQLQKWLVLLKNSRTKTDQVSTEYFNVDIHTKKIILFNFDNTSNVNMFIRQSDIFVGRKTGEGGFGQFMGMFAIL